MPTKYNTLKKKTFLAKMESTLGNITASCKEANINRSTYYDWMEKDPKFKQAIDDLAESNIDFAESYLKQQIKEGNTTAIIFYLKTKGKSRGYIETKEVTGKDGEPLLSSKPMTLDEARQMMKELEDDCMTQ